MLNGVLKHFSHLLHAGTLPLVHISYDGSACGLLDLSSWSSFPTLYTIVVASTLVASQTFSLFEFLSTFITCVDYLLLESSFPDGLPPYGVLHCEKHSVSFDSTDAGITWFCYVGTLHVNCK